VIAPKRRVTVIVSMVVHGVGRIIGIADKSDPADRQPGWYPPKWDPEIHFAFGAPPTPFSLLMTNTLDVLGRAAPQSPNFQERTRDYEYSKILRMAIFYGKWLFILVSSSIVWRRLDVAEEPFLPQILRYDGKWYGPRLVSQANRIELCEMLGFIGLCDDGNAEGNDTLRLGQ
jgi:hypothetical protein